MWDVTDRVEFYNFRDSECRGGPLGARKFNLCRKDPDGDVLAILRDEGGNVYINSRSAGYVMNLNDFSRRHNAFCDVRLKQPAASPAPATS